MNRVILIGRLTRDAELKRLTNSDNAIANFSIAVDNFGKDANGERRPAIFLNCSAWGKQAENLTKYTRKGSNVAVDGRLTQRTYTRKDGTTAQVIEIVCDNIQFLDPKGTVQEGGLLDVPTPVDLDQHSSNDVDAPNIADDDELPF